MFSALTAVRNGRLASARPWGNMKPLRSSFRSAAALALVGAAPVFAVAACNAVPSVADAPLPSPTDAGAPVDGARNAADGGAPKADGEAPPDGAAAGALFGFVGAGDGKIRVYDVSDTTGAWSLKRESNVGGHPSFLAFDPSRRRVVATDESGGLVRSFAFDPATGALSAVNERSAGGAGTTHVSFDPAGTWVMVANYTGGNMSILPIDAAGVLGPPADTKASGEKSHWAGTNPSGTHVFVPALGTDAVSQYILDGSTGKLTSNGVAPVPKGAGPRHLAFHPSEKWAYLINELAISVTAMDFDKASGKLTAKGTTSALPAGQGAAGVSGAEIALHPSGKFVYASTRGYNSIAAFHVASTDGALTLVANVPTGGDRPRSFAIDPGGTLLFAANQVAAAIVGFRIDSASGALTPLGNVVPSVPSPTFVGLARIP